VLTPLLSERTRGVRGASAVLPVVLGAAALLAAATPAGAQNATSSLRGVVTNQAGAPVSDAQVQVRNVASGVRRGALTNASGFYNVGGLQPGAYEVRVLRIGFTPTTTAVRLTVGEVTTRDFRIGEAAVQLGTVVATAQRSTDRSTSEVAATISTEQIENLPQNNRNFIDFAALAPGVQRRGSGISSGGVSENNANLFIDGASYKSDLLPGGIVGQDRGLGGRNLRGVGQVSGNPFPQSAVQEFRVVTQNYKAEYQRASGAVVTAATKAGTNDVTGDLFFYGQNRNLLATSYYDRADRIARPEYARGQFGGSVGGPIVRDRAHFFGSYEATYVDLNTRVAFRPPPALASQLPDSLLRGQGQYATPLRSNLFFGKADYTINDRQGLIFTANVRRDKDSRGASGNAGSEGLNNVRTGIDNYLLRHTYTAGAVTNEAQAGYQRQDVSNRGVGTGAQFVYDVYNVTRGAFPSIQQFRQDKYTIRDDLSYAVGSHVFKGGAITEFLRYDLDKRNSELPVFVFRPLGQGNPAGFGVGVPTTAALEIGNGIVRENNTQFGAYLQDDWTIARRLTLNLGLRWDVETNALNNSFRTPQVVRDSITRFLQTNPFFDAERHFNDGPSDRRRFLGAVQPRVGFSFDAEGNGRTLVFGGAGVYYDRIFADILLDERLRTQRPRYTFLFRAPGAPADPNTVPFTPNLYSREALVALVQSGQAARPEAFLIPDDLRPPRSNQASLGVRHERAGYQLSLTGTAVDGTNGFRYAWGQREVRPGAEFGSFRPIPGFGAILRATDAGRSWYRALLFQASRPLTERRRWGGDLSYTLAKSETNTRNGDDPFALDYVSEADFRRIRSPFDERHRVVLNLAAASRSASGRAPSPRSARAALHHEHQLRRHAGAAPAAARAEPRRRAPPVLPGERLLRQRQRAGLRRQPGRPRRGVGDAAEGRWFGPFGKWAYRRWTCGSRRTCRSPGAAGERVLRRLQRVQLRQLQLRAVRVRLFNDRGRAPLRSRPSTRGGRRSASSTRCGSAVRRHPPRYIPRLAAAALLAGAAAAPARGQPAAPAGAAAAYRPTPGERAFLDTLGRRTFDWFWDTTDPRTGLTPDRWPTRSFSSVASVGFALTAYPIGVERGWVTRERARERVLTTLRFFWGRRRARSRPGCRGTRASSTTSSTWRPAAASRASSSPRSTPRCCWPARSPAASTSTAPAPASARCARSPTRCTCAPTGTGRAPGGRW
jgi:hypothetical protein